MQTKHGIIVRSTRQTGNIVPNWIFSLEQIEDDALKDVCIKLLMAIILPLIILVCQKTEFLSIFQGRGENLKNADESTNGHEVY